MPRRSHRCPRSELQSVREASGTCPRRYGSGERALATYQAKFREQLDRPTCRALFETSRAGERGVSDEDRLAHLHPPTMASAECCSTGSSSLCRCRISTVGGPVRRRLSCRTSGTVARRPGGQPNGAVVKPNQVEPSTAGTGASASGMCLFSCARSRCSQFRLSASTGGCLRCKNRGRAVGVEPEDVVWHTAGEPAGPDQRTDPVTACGHVA
jgi:hypothetical protein